MRKQKTAMRAGALVDDAKKWKSIDWKHARRQVRRLQVRIAKAVKEQRWNRVRALQYLLTRSFYAKLLAVKRVTSNKGKKTPGIDGVLWQGARAKWRAVFSLRRRGYKPQPLRRIYIPKKNGKKRPLSIPTMYDRAMQALYKLSLAPVAETTADRNSYGFREGRSCADAIQAAFNALSKPNSATWVLEGDIKGGIISPMLSNMTLDGLEQAVRCAVPRRSRVNFVRYADDFIITGKSRRLLERQIRPAVEDFLADRGLTLSKEKTVITYIKKGFTFLGQTFRKHGRVLHITPSVEGVLALIRKVGTLIRKHVSVPMPVLIKKLNETLRGWGNYHRHVVASGAFGRIDTYVFEQLWRMVRRRHQNKSKGWLINRYWSATGRKHRFAVRAKTASGKTTVYEVIKLHAIGIRRYIKIKADANPYLPEYAEYFWRRRHIKESKLLAAMSARELRVLRAA